MPPHRLSTSKSQINFLPKAPQRRSSLSHVPRSYSLAAAFRTTRSITPPKVDHIQEDEEEEKKKKKKEKEGASVLAYLSLWKGVRSLWRGIDWYVGRMSSGWRGM
ncbi:hypothetical protein COCVIDRAFT_89452 [Bipolaris victoriae FI3]|uniref:Uncharacterized protein n=2 Tax=Bipolaris TaxID=33194 RepID=W6Y202_COCC2|nr:uncharacterized protein COCCADRAFT_107424 [Bipolaris zeicola 26-R-13]XP_014560394.1 hypothetical protein COCVIDRAFT_89452 [Bipolaris victoriae FI3]EUC29109.1 hypothetical protein COCCADRAFT_107424 [Bipolaris zeicola 26-R-13]